ncbi:Protein C1orf43-like protein [Frankliniella fusca]|uniref:Protein C1orf43-like protein n=1 Tax=Frankliniella fusca TaxID=407009 RepID=A0AAE1H0L9_9NEOP|nr:Protein C1orf43-like protein [Frankliniella fusca]
MVEQLSGVTVVIFIACGVLTVFLLFIFAKRQIMRFALRSRRGPHVALGHDADKGLRSELERRLDVIPRIVNEPKLINKDDARYILPPGSTIPPYYYRLKAVDDVKTLEMEILKQDSNMHRHPTENLRAFLLSSLAAPLDGSGQKMVHQFCDMYEHARHDPADFGEEEYQAYSRLFLKLIDVAKLLKSFPNSRKTSPNRTPVRRVPDLTKNRSSTVDIKLQLKDENISRPSTLTVPAGEVDSSETPV